MSPELGTVRTGSATRMEIALDSRSKRVGLLGAAFLLSGAFLTAASLQFVADCLAHSVNHSSIALRLAPGNAEYHEIVGHELFETRGNVVAALQQYRLATTLNPHDANYWLAVARSEQILNHTAEQRYALERAIESDPTTPDVAWAAANSFLAEGDIGMALREFRVVVENQPEMAYAALGLCSHVADVATIIQKVLPPSPAAYLTLIDFLTWQKKTAEAIQVWQALVQLGKPFEVKPALAYIDYLISQRDVRNARLAWRQTAQLCGLSARLESDENLIVNPHFDSDILNGGFDWRYQRQANVEVALDSTEFRGGHRSLSIVFDGPGANEAGISQYVVIQPGTTYQFAAYYKADAMDGAGGPQFSIQDAYTGANYFSSDYLRDSDTWREVDGEFKAGTDAQLITIKVVRIPSGRPIRGRLWIDDFRLTEKDKGL